MGHDGSTPCPYALHHFLQRSRGCVLPGPRCSHCTCTPPNPSDLALQLLQLLCYLSHTSATRLPCVIPLPCPTTAAVVAFCVDYLRNAASMRETPNPCPITAAVNAWCVHYLTCPYHRSCHCIMVPFLHNAAPTCETPTRCPRTTAAVDWPLSRTSTGFGSIKTRIPPGEPPVISIKTRVRPGELPVMPVPKQFALCTLWFPSNTLVVKRYTFPSTQCKLPPVVCTRHGCELTGGST